MKEKKTDPSRDDNRAGQTTERPAQALWLGKSEGTLDMGPGRGPRNLKPHELVSWFFSRDGH